MDDMIKQFDKNLGWERRGVDSLRNTYYKNRGRYENQDQRRAELLNLQKSNRNDHLDTFRGLYSWVDASAERTELFNDTPQGAYQPTLNVPGFTQNNYKNMLMKAEWLTAKPADFSKNWFMTPCAKGIRVLVVAGHGITRLYTKAGELCASFVTRLPGGHGHEKRKDGSVLDGYYSRTYRTIFIADVLVWRNHVLADKEMEYRRYWLQGKFSEHPIYEQLTRRYKVCLRLLPATPCNELSIQDFLITYPPLRKAKLDGLLFYHKKGTYVSGQTPLVGYLEPYMVPEVLYPGMKMHKEFEAKKPENYVNQAMFIQQYQINRRLMENLRLQRFEGEYNADNFKAKFEAKLAAQKSDKGATSSTAKDPQTIREAGCFGNASKEVGIAEASAPEVGYDDNSLRPIVYPDVEVYENIQNEAKAVATSEQITAQQPCCQYCCQFAPGGTFNNQYQPYKPLNMYDAGNQGDNEEVEESVTEFLVSFKKKFII